MDYIAMFSFRQGLGTTERDTALARRASWNYPSGVTPIAEYWPMSGTTQVVSIFSCNDLGPVMEIVFEWDDAFDIDIHPAVSAEQGLRMGADAMAKIPRMRQAQPATVPTA
jgi:hypothetical protein